MAFDTFLNIPGATDGPGTPASDTTVINGTQYVAIDDFSLKIENHATIGSTSGGAGAGKAVFDPLSFTIPANFLAPRLFVASASGKPYQTATVIVRQPGGGTPSTPGGLVFLHFAFKLVFVNSVTFSGSSGDETVNETVTLQYGALTITYKPQASSGSAVTPATGSWDITANAPS